MIKVSVLYPNGPDTRFDMAYYLATHIPMVQQRLSPALKGTAVERGIAGGQPGSAPAFLVMGHLTFESAEAFQGAFAPHAEAILSDIPKYTNVVPTIQISEVHI